MSAYKKSTARDLTAGSPGKQILTFALPMMIGNIFQQFYNLADSIVVGRFVGPNELGGIGSIGSLHFLIFSLGYGMSAGIGIYASILYGAGEKRKLTRMIYNSFYAILAVSLLITGIGVLGADTILHWMNTPEAVFPYAAQYMKITMLGAGATLAYSGISSIQRAFGDSTRPLYIMMTACVVNIILDLVFVVGFHWDVYGVAAATVTAQAMAAVLSFAVAWRTLPLFRYERGALIPDRNIIHRIIRFGLPLIGQNVLIALSCIALQVVVNGFGEQIVTANTAVSKIEQLVQQPYNSIASALSAFTGQNIGAGRIDRVKKGFRSGMLYIGIFTAVMMVIMQFFGREILSVFVTDERIIEIGATGLKINSWFYIFLGLIYGVRGTLNGAGDAAYSALNGIVELACRVSLAAPLTKIAAIGMWGCFYCSGLTWMITGLLSLARYCVGSWMKRYELKANAQ